MKSNCGFTLFILCSSLVSGLAACNPQHQSDRFQRFRSRLPELSVPLVLHCGIGNDLAQSAIVDTNYDEYFIPLREPIGRLWPQQNYITVLFGEVADYMEPQLVTFSTSGKQIDSLFVSVNCESEPGLHGNSVMYLNSDLVILTVDTIFTSSVDSMHHEIAGTDSLVVYIERHKIDEQGHFIQLENDKKVLHP